MEREWRRIFARQLRALRERARLTQSAVAAALEMSETVYARYEAGKIWPSLGRLRRLCQVLGCSADALLGFAYQGEPPPDPSDPLPLRRLRRQLRQAGPESLRAVTRFLDALDRHGGLRVPGEPDE
jgi:transcriptional regulator with XRE-family HTH domain